ncbi:hypothetical protein L917_18193 [Phytophthora nicotianae]|uniref:Uncharacterized protein n=1 Tax=Phytophthora nicotianae TaxID=4792 RepID=W2KAR9_PHYNI|nr:hypothetical protein L916_18368 [Phytophthora nicotianae]ETL81475.1 hypothetical protein L917_18193 [Phytophthora nicotianae]
MTVSLFRSEKYDRKQVRDSLGETWKGFSYWSFVVLVVEFHMRASWVDYPFGYVEKQKKTAATHGAVHSTVKRQVGVMNRGGCIRSQCRGCVVELRSSQQNRNAPHMLAVCESIYGVLEWIEPPSSLASTKALAKANFNDLTDLRLHFTNTRWFCSKACVL